MEFYIFEIRDDARRGLLKIGDTTIETACSIEELLANCKEWNQTARERIKAYTNTAGIEFICCTQSWQYFGQGKG